MAQGGGLSRCGSNIILVHTTPKNHPPQKKLAGIFLFGTDTPLAKFWDHLPNLLEKQIPSQKIFFNPSQTSGDSWTSMGFYGTCQDPSHRDTCNQVHQQVSFASRGRITRSNPDKITRTVQTHFPPRPRESSNSKASKRTRQSCQEWEVKKAQESKKYGMKYETLPINISMKKSIYIKNKTKNKFP